MLWKSSDHKYEWYMQQSTVLLFLDKDEIVLD